MILIKTDKLCSWSWEEEDIQTNSCEVTSWEERSRKNKVKWQHRCQNLEFYGIKMDFKLAGFESVDWSLVAHNIIQWRAHMNAVMNFQNFIKAGKFLYREETVSFSRKMLHLSWLSCSPRM
jgi:hypothetical protein